MAEVKSRKRIIKEFKPAPKFDWGRGDRLTTSASFRETVCYADAVNRAALTLCTGILFAVSTKMRCSGSYFYCSGWQLWTPFSPDLPHSSLWAGSN
jgi:hypothetical protein